MNAFQRSLAALALLLVVLSFWPRSEKSVPTVSPAPRNPSAAVSSQIRTGLLSYQVARQDLLVATTPDPAATAGTTTAPVRAAGTPHTRFAGWVERYFNEAWAGDQAALLDEGERLALERREYLAREIQENPRAALEHAVPYGWRQRLPARISRHFEEVVSGLANYEVFMASPVPGADYHLFKCASYRYATLGGRTYRAYVYGARLGQMAHERLPMQGIAIDDALAVHEEPARLLEAEETAAVRAAGGAPVPGGCAVCGQVAADGGRLLDVAGSYLNVCNASDAAMLNRALMNLDAQKLAAAYSALSVWTNAPPKPPLASFGPRRTLYMRLVFRDDITIPISDQQAASELQQANAFYIEASYGKTALIPAVTPILTLPHPKALYSKLGPGRLMSDALVEAAKQGYAAENFELLLARFTPVPGFNWGGLGGGKQAWLQYNGVGLIIHEVGHCYGLGHANYWETRRAPLPTPPPDRWDTDSLLGHDSMIGAGDDIEYGDIFDVMGSGGGEYQGGRGPVTNQPISSFAGHFNPVGKSILGWLPESAIAQAADNRTNRIYVFDTPVLVENRAYALKLRKDEQRSYWVSARAKISGNQWISNGVSLHWGAWPQLIGYSTLIDTTPGTPQGREDSAIVVGRTFTDPEVNLHITPVAKGGSGLDTYFDVVVNRGAFPGNAAPTAELRVSTNRVAPGRPVTFTVDALDPDGDTLAYYWDISDGTLGTNGPTLTRSWTVEGDYRVRVEVSDMRGHVVSRHVVVQVGARDGFRISGTVFDSRGLPLAGARVANGMLTNTTELATNYQATFTDSDGQFTLINELPGDREVTAFKHGYRTTPQNFNRVVTVADQDVMGLEFLAQEQPQVSVRLTTDADMVRGRPGVFTFSRTGDTNTQLRAVFTLGGTAKEGTDFTRLTNTTTHTNALRTLLANVNLPVPFYVVDFATGAVTARVTINTTTNATAVDDKYLSAAVMYALQKEQVYATNVDDGQGGQTNGLATNYTYLTGWEVINFNNEDTWFQTYGDYAVGSPGEARMTFKAAPATNPVVSLVAVGKAASENSDDSALFLLTRTGQTNVAVTVRLGFTGTATYGEDYRPLPDWVHVPAGVTSVPLLLYVIPDLYLEGNETVSISILPDSSYRVGSAKADLTIGDNDLPALTVVATDPVASETGNDNGAVVFTRIGDLTRDLTVNYLVGGTAVGGRDYRALPGSIVIPAGQPSVTLVIQPRDNRLQDGGNSLEIILSDSPLYNVGVPGVAHLFIQDGAFPTVSIQATVTNASEPNTFGEFTLTRAGDTRSELVVNLAVGGTARPVADYSPITALGRIPAGAASVTIRVNPANDSIREDAETVIAEILPGTNYNIGSRQDQVVISDDDSGLLGVGFTFLGTTVSEGARTGLVAVSVSANPNQNEDVTVDWKVTGGTALPELDYPGTNAGRLVFTNVDDPGISNRVQLIEFPIIDDTNAEPDKTIVITLVEPAPLVSNEVVTNEITLTNAQGDPIGTTNVLITNVIITPIPLNAVLEAYRSHTINLYDDDASVVSLAVEDPVAMEEGRKRALLLLRREGSTARDQVVRLAIAGSAGNGSDYETIPGEVVIPSGESELPLPVIPVDDPMQEFLEDVHIAIIEAPGATLLSNQAVVVTIVDNDGTVEFRSPTYTAFESTGRAEIALRRTSDTNGSATVAYQVVAGTATTNDFVPTNGVVSFAPGETVRSFFVELLDDRLVEPEKTVRLTLRNLSDGVPLGGQIEATLTILDDDTIVELLAPAVQALENDSFAGVIVTRHGIITNQLRVELAATTNGTAVADLDFVVTNYPVVFQPGQTAAVAQVVLLDDTLFDGDKVVAVTLTNLDATATLGAVTNGAITVLDDECAIELVATNYTVDEYMRTLTITLQRTGSALHAVQVDYNTADQTAQAGRDYVAEHGTLRFSGADLLRTQDGTGVVVLQPGETNQTLVLRILDDVLGEGNETFRLNLTNAKLTVGAGLPDTVVLGVNTNATVLIVDNETPGSVDFEFNPGTGANDTVLALALQADAKIVLGGRFTEVDSVALNHIARLHDDGYLDTFFNPGEGFNDTVLALAPQADGRLLVGGQFTRFNTTNTLNRIARLNADGAVDPEFRVGAGADAPVRALAVETAGTILVGGEFQTINSASRARLARLMPDGTVDTTFNPRLDGTVHALAVQPDGRILVGGAFATAGNLGRPFLARLNADGSADATFNPGGGPDGVVHGLALQSDGRLLIAGAFHQVSGQPRRGVARLNADGTLDTSFNPGEGASDIVYGVGLAADGKVLLGGAFTQFDGQERNRFARLNPDGSLDPVFDIGTGANGTVFTLVVQPDSAMLIGGDFTEVNRLPRNRIARIHGDERFRLNVLQFSTASYRVVENAGEATITVVRAGDISVPAQVDYHTADGTAIAGQDYESLRGTLRFEAGEIMKTFNVRVLDDALGEGNLTVNLHLSNLPPGFSLTARLQAVLTIEDDESAVAFASMASSVRESEGAATILVRRTGPTNTVVSVEYATADGTAAAGRDYDSASGTLTFAPGMTEQGFTVTVLDNSEIEADRTVLLRLTNPQGGAVLGRVNTATLTILDDDSVENYALNITPPLGGTVVPPSGLYPAGSAQTLTAVPAQGFRFVGWEGTVVSTANPLVLVMDRNHVLTAKFQPVAYTYTFEPPFSAEDLRQSPWQSVSTQPWQLQSSTAASGRFALRSGVTADGQESTLQFIVESRGGPAAFDVRVSSEANWDFAEFYVDGLRLERWTGEVPWRTYLFNLGPGTHTLAWRYVKDNNFAGGLDAMFVDNIYVPQTGPDPTDPAAQLRLVTVPGGLQLWVTGKVGLTYTIEASSDLVAWSQVSSHLNTTGTIVVPLTIEPGTPARYYRVVTTP